MIKLALAIGFISVFGFVTYALVILLYNKFNKDNGPSGKTTDSSKPQEKQ